MQTELQCCSYKVRSPLPGVNTAAVNFFVVSLVDLKKRSLPWSMEIPDAKPLRLALRGFGYCRWAVPTPVLNYNT